MASADSSPYLPYAAMSQLCAAFAVPLTVAGIATGGLGGTFCFVGAGFGWLGVAIFAFLAWRGGGLIRRLKARHFVHWTYDDAQWHAFLDRTRDAKRVRRQFWGWSLGVCAVMCLGLYGDVLSDEEDSKPPNMNRPLAVVVMFGVASAIAWSANRFAQRHDARLRDSRAECWIGELGYYLTGESGRWEGSWKNPGIDEEFGDLLIGFSSGPDSHVALRAPVPVGQEKMAAKLVRHFQLD